MYGMWGSDQDLTSTRLVRRDDPAQSLADLKGRVVAVGAVDSPQATLIPLGALARAGLQPGVDVTVKVHDVLRGKHGDHIGGERDAVADDLIAEVRAEDAAGQPYSHAPGQA